MGKTIDYITYYTDKGIYQFDIQDTYVPLKFNYELEQSADESEISVKGLPDGYEVGYTVDTAPVQSENGLVSTNGLLPGSHVLGVTDSKGIYAPINANFVLTTQESVAVYDEAGKKLIAAQGYDDKMFTNYIANISSVNVNGTDYRTSGRGSVKIINTDGTIAADATPFAEGSEFTITVKAMGFAKDITFVYNKTSAVQPTPTVEPENPQPPASVKEVTVAKVGQVKASVKSKKVTVTWKKAAGAAGYQVQYAATKDFKKPVAVLVKKNKTTIKKGIKSKKTYYMRVRAYKTVNGKKTLGKWSTVRQFKMK